LFWGAIAYKLPQGGYVAVLITLFFAAIMLTWYAGEFKLIHYRKLYDTSTPIHSLHKRFVVTGLDSGNEQNENVKVMDKTSEKPTEDLVELELDKTSEKPTEDLVELDDNNLIETFENKKKRHKLKEWKQFQKWLQWRKQKKAIHKSELVSDTEPIELKQKELTTKDTKKPNMNPLLDDDTASDFESEDEPDTERKTGLIPDPEIFHVMMKDGSGLVKLHGIAALPRVGVFLAYSKTKTPLAFEMFLNRVCGVPQTVIFLRMTKVSIPYVLEKDRVRVQKCFSSFYFISISFGFAEHTTFTTITDILTSQPEGLPSFTVADMTLFVPADTIAVIQINPFWKVLLSVYAGMKSVYFGEQKFKLPPDNTIYIATVATL